MDVDEAKGSLQAFVTTQGQKEKKKRKSAKNAGLIIEKTNLVALRHKVSVLITTLQNSLPGPPFSI
jgi:hypothetical protein